jgi:hypothetical protein
MGEGDVTHVVRVLEDALGETRGWDSAEPVGAEVQEVGR